MPAPARRRTPPLEEARARLRGRSQGGRASPWNHRQTESGLDGLHKSPNWASGASRRDDGEPPEDTLPGDGYNVIVPRWASSRSDEPLTMATTVLTSSVNNQRHRADPSGQARQERQGDECSEPDEDASHHLRHLLPRAVPFIPIRRSAPPVGSVKPTSRRNSTTAGSPRARNCTGPATPQINECST